MTGAPQPRSGVQAPTPAAARLSAARLSAVQALYQIELAGGEAADVVRQFLAHRLDGGEAGEDVVDADARLFAELVEGVARRRAALDDLLTAALSADWPPARLEVILRCILLVGAYELMARPNVPARVVITEHVDLAHAFFDGAEPGMVNGVLDRIARSVRPGELEGGSGDGNAPAG